MSQTEEKISKTNFIKDDLRLLDATELAEKIKLSYNSVLAMARQKIIPSSKHNRMFLFPDWLTEYHLSIDNVAEILDYSRAYVVILIKRHKNDSLSSGKPTFIKSSKKKGATFRFSAEFVEHLKQQIAKKIQEDFEEFGVN